MAEMRSYSVAYVTSLEGEYSEHQDFVNEVMENAPDEWDDDVAMEAIAIKYVRYLESEVLRRGGRLYPYEDDSGTDVWGESG